MRGRVVGLLVNPVAGRGAARNLEVARAAVRALAPERVITAAGDLGHAAVPDATVVPDLLPEGRDGTLVAARALLACNVDVLVVVGGDGTLADVAGVLADTAPDLPLLGLGAGSTNVGGLVTCRAGEVDSLAGATLDRSTVTALHVRWSGEQHALAFNDVVIATIVLGTLDDRVVDLDAAALLEGRRVPSRPSSVGGPSVNVTKHAADGECVVLGRGTEVATLVVGLVDTTAFYGKALIGGVGLSSLAGLPAGALVATAPLVRTQLPAADDAADEPLRTAYVGLAGGEIVRATGFDAPAVLCADGNPLRLLAPTDVVEIGVRPRAVTVLRRQAGGAS
jgi:hypothetical protein